MSLQRNCDGLGGVIKERLDLHSVGSEEAFNPFKQEVGMLVALWRNSSRDWRLQHQFCLVLS